jgi:general secretion pathway protein D
MRNFATLGLIGLLLASPATAQTGTDQEPTRRGRAPSTLDLLNRRVPEIMFEEQPLEQVMEFIADWTEMNVVVNWQVLEDVGLERDKPITVKVRDVLLSQVLWLIMREAGGTDLKLAYRASGNVLVLSTEEDLGQEMLVKVYDVSDLLIRPPRFVSTMNFDPGQALQQASQGGAGGGMGSGGGGGGGGLFGGGQGGQGGRNERDEDTAGAGMDELVQLIIRVIEPDSWEENGGLGTIEPFGNVLVVRNTILVHQRLAGYVEEEGWAR